MYIHHIISTLCLACSKNLSTTTTTTPSPSFLQRMVASPVVSPVSRRESRDTVDQGARGEEEGVQHSAQLSFLPNRLFLVAPTPVSTFSTGSTYTDVNMCVF